MIRTENSDYAYVEFNEKNSNFMAIFERENKENYNKSKDKKVLTDDEYCEKYYKYVREYFCFMNLTEAKKPMITNKVEIGSTLISILNNKMKLYKIFQEYKNTILKANSIQELENTIINLKNKLKNININFIFFVYLLKCFLLELELENQPIEKSKHSLAILLNDFSEQLQEIEEIVNILFLMPRNYFDNKEKMDELRLNISNYFTLPESNNVYELYKYYPRIIRTEYQICNLTDLVYSTIYHVSQNRDSIQICNYCNNYFVTNGMRNDAKNCCIECSNQNRKKLTAEGRGEFTNVYSRIANTLKRHKKLSQFNTFKKRYLNKKEIFKERYEKGDLYKEKLLEWLIYYENKHINKL